MQKKKNRVKKFELCRSLNDLVILQNNNKDIILPKKNVDSSLMYIKGTILF